MMKCANLFIYWFFFGCMVVMLSPVYGQRSIKTLQVTLGDRPNSYPVITLQSHEYVTISFDELSHDFTHYYYRIVHCDAQWEKTQDLFESDYLRGINGAYYIEDYAPSRNTSLLYTHYRLRLPNENISPLISGNYKVLFYEESIDTPPVLEARFSVVDPLVGIAPRVSGNTEIDYNAAHQQVDLTVQLKGVQPPQPLRDIRIIVMQNRESDRTVLFPKPTAINAGTALHWTHQRALVFPAGNTYRKFEILDDHNAYQGVDYIRWLSPFYHATLYPDAPRLHYLYDEDAAGGYVIRNANHLDSDTESDYLYVHFTLQSPPLFKGEIYLKGRLGSEAYPPAVHRLKYNAEKQAYETNLLLKQGYYNYQYRYVPHTQGDDIVPIEGDYYQTQNEYCVFVYCKRPERRYEELVGFLSFTSDNSM